MAVRSGWSWSTTTARCTSCSRRLYERVAATLDVVERMAADVLVMDLRMPVMDGLAATATMHDRFPEIEIVAFTSSDAPGVGRAMLCAGASRHFVKPDVGGLVGYVARR
jgi:CheY-like chemotaxis protein